ncbi:MAG: hypothetical protein QOG31_216 [Thermoplasmata archaeon]|jgi:hypothetical protein|nr:hypothetical protein [Thermoplasmata archaeon]
MAVVQCVVCSVVYDITDEERALRSLRPCNCGNGTFVELPT